jgi:hypothetical protein
MKFLFVLASILFIQSALCQDTGVTDGKKCEDFLGADTCTKLRNLATLLHEKTSIVTDAVKDAIAHHKTKASEMLEYIKSYMAERFPCDQVLTEDICKKIFALGARVKLTTIQVRMAIENAIATGVTKTTDIYNKAIEFMTTQITCSNIFGDVTCSNLKQVLQKFHEQVSLLNEAIMTAALKHYNTVTDMLKSVKDTLIEKAVNFKCEDVLPATTCNQIREIGAQLKLTTAQIRLAIETAVVNGAQNVKDLYQKTIDFMTTEINCENILGATACTNLVEAAKKLKEQTILIKEAIMAAVLKHTNNVKDILTSVKDTLVEKATNFKCTDVMTQGQCDFLTQLTQKFKLRSSELLRLIKDAVVNGTTTAKQIYKVTIGELIEDAKNIKCEDLIPASTCDTLDAFAQNFHIKAQEVTLAVKIAVANGLNTVSDIYNSVKEFLIEKVSCDSFLPTSVCDKIESLANRLHVSYKKVTEKLRALVASGVTSVKDLSSKIFAYIWDLFWGFAKKRSLDMTDFTDKIMEYVTKVIAVGKDVKDKLKAEITQAIAQGKVTLFKFKEYVKELIAKYGPQSDELQQSDDIHRSLIEQLKEALKKAHGAAKDTIEKLLAKTKEQLEKLKEFIKQILGNQDQADDALNISFDIFADIARQEIEDEVMSAEKEISDLEQL